jgi:hypothetical protein
MHSFRTLIRALEKPQHITMRSVVYENPDNSGSSALEGGPDHIPWEMSLFLALSRLGNLMDAS